MTQSARWAQSQDTAAPAGQRANLWAAPSMKIALTLIAFFNSGNFGGDIVPGSEESNFQQYVGLALWIAIAALSYFRRPVLTFRLSAGLVCGLAFYALAVLSAVWSPMPAASYQKALALGIVTFGAYRLVRSLPFQDIVECLLHGLAALCVLSILAALFLPSIGVDSNYQHSGQWQGVFAQKQNLGICAAILLFYASSRLMGPLRDLWRRQNLYYGGAALAAVICAIASGSRGGGALAVLAVIGLYLSRRSKAFVRALAFFPFVMCLVCVALIAYFVETGAARLLLFGEELDFTERTFIWQHALSYFSAAPWLGVGINGFWTQPDVKALFIEHHRWFLNDYHNGYIGIVVETGAIGYALFSLSYLFYALDIGRGLRRTAALADEVGIALLYTCLMFFIDFTELVFMKSTNVAATMIAICFFMAYARAPPVVDDNPRDAVAPPRLPGGRRFARQARQ